MSKIHSDFNLELFFSALADRTRLRLIHLIGDDQVCVCFFVEVLQLNQPKISRHLAYLRRAEIVSSRRDGTWVHYRLTEPKNRDAAKVLREVRNMLAKDPEMQEDRKRLVTICCADVLPAAVQGAPLPASLANIRCAPQC